MTRAPTRLQQKRMDDLLALLVKAADAGAPCQSNPEIAELLMLSNVSEIQPLLHRMEDDGLIIVERTANRRRVIIVATGASTAWTDYSRRGRPRVLAGVRDADDRERQYTQGFRGELPDDRYVDRSPCPRCGARADIGCRHRGATSAATAPRRTYAPLDGAVSAYARAAGFVA